MQKRGVAALLAALVTLGLVWAASADVPSDQYSTVTCWCDVDATSGVGSGAVLPWECTISPDGQFRVEDIWVGVQVQNPQNQPLPNCTVTVNAVLLDSLDECVIWDNDMQPVGACDDPEDPQVQVTPGTGYVLFMFDEGGVGPLPPYNPAVFPNMDFHALMVGPGPGSADKYCDHQLEVVGYDQNCDCQVNLPDLAIFAGQGWGNQHLKSDFDHTGAVGLVDFAMFASKWGAACNTQ